MLARVVSVSLAALVALTAAAAAQETPVNSVTVTGVTGEQAAQVHRRIRARAGDAYVEKAIQEDYLSILKLPFVLSASVRKTESPEGVDLIYEVTSRPPVPEVRFVGNRKFKDKKLRKIGKLEDFRHYDLARLSEARTLILDEYLRKGYIFARVSFAAEDDGSVVFTIDEGRRTKVKRVSIIGNTRFSDRLLKKQVRTKTRRYLILSYRLDRDTVEEDVTSLREFYRNKGYLDASVRARVDVDKKTGKRITVEYIVDEGPLYTVSSIEFRGNTLIEDRHLRDRLKMTEKAPFSPEGLARDVRALADAYGLIGHIDAGARPYTTIAQDAPRVAVVYDITEGETIYINEVAIMGNDRTRDNVIRRDLKFAPGERFNTEALRRSKANLQRLGYFTKVQIEQERTDDPLKRDVIVNVEETSTGNLTLGLGASSDSGITGQIVYSQRNYDYRRPPRSWRDVSEGRAWVGGGQIFQLSAAPGTEYDHYSLSYRDPRLNDSRYSFGLSASRWERARETYDERRTEGTVSVGRSFGEHSSWEASTTVGKVKISDLELYDRNGDGFITVDDIPDYLADVYGTNYVNLLGLTLRHDTRNSLFIPTEGHLVSATVEASAEAIGSDYDFLRFILQGRWYRELSRDDLDRPHVLSWRARTGILLPESGSEDSPIFERFFVGGAADVRGFKFRHLGPHDGDTELGGEFMAVSGLQYDFPLAGEHFRGVVFWDSGTLVDSPGDFRLDEVRHALGFGFRVTLPPPVPPFSIDFGFPINDQDEDKTRIISITFGRAI
ncbi:MAG: outer membrane protein assembly factor BamA [Planctomycetota bacterium]